MKKLFKTFKELVMMALVVTYMLIASILLPSIAHADTQNFPQGADVEVISLHVSGQYTATTANVSRFQLPFGARLVGVTATARASGGTSPTLTVDLKRGATTVLNAPLSITAGTVTEAVITTPTLPDESVMSVDFTIGGTSPTWNDITILLTLVRR